MVDTTETYNSETKGKPAADERSVLKPFSPILLSEPGGLGPRSPYPGLRPFETKDGPFFRGRNAQIRDLKELLSNHHFITVTGRSGSGKSSLVKAGLFPWLLGGRLSEAGGLWRTVEMRPGNSPVSALIEALANALPSPGNVSSPSRPSELRRQLHQGGLAKVLELSELGADTNLLLLVDQFEELFRYRDDITREAISYVNYLVDAFQTPVQNLFVILTMRSDYIGDCARFHGLAEAINKSIYLIPPLTEEQLKMVIEEPATMVGGSVDEDLTNILIEDMGNETDNLPLLQHALMWMWTIESAKKEGTIDARAEAAEGQPTPQGIRLTTDSYNHKDVGNLFIALSKHGDAVLREMNGEERRVSKLMFQRLAERDTGQRDIRHPTTCKDILDISGVSLNVMRPIAERFASSDCSFIRLTSAAGADDSGEDQVQQLEESDTLDVTHEALIRQWQQLKDDWLNEEIKHRDIYLDLLRGLQKHRSSDQKNWITQFDLYSTDDWIEWLESLDAHAVGGSAKLNLRPSVAWAKRYHPKNLSDLALDDVLDYINHSRQHWQNQATSAKWDKRIRYGTGATIISASLLLLFSLGKNYEDNRNKYNKLSNEKIFVLRGIKEKHLSKSKNITIKHLRNALRSEGGSTAPVLSSIIALDRLNSQERQFFNEYQSEWKSYEKYYKEEISKLDGTSGNIRHFPIYTVGRWFADIIWLTESGGEIDRPRKHVTTWRNEFLTELDKLKEDVRSHMLTSMASIPRPVFHPLDLPTKSTLTGDNIPDLIRTSPDGAVIGLAYRNGTIRLRDASTLLPIGDKELRPSLQVMRKDTENGDDTKIEIKELSISKNAMMITAFYEKTYNPKTTNNRAPEHYVVTWLRDRRNLSPVWNVLSSVPYDTTNSKEAADLKILHDIKQNQLLIVAADGTAQAQKIHYEQQDRFDNQPIKLFNKNKLKQEGVIESAQFKSTIEHFERLPNDNYVAVWAFRYGMFVKFHMQVFDATGDSIKPLDKVSLPVYSDQGQAAVETKIGNDGYIYLSQHHIVQRWLIPTLSKYHKVRSDLPVTFVSAKPEGSVRVWRAPAGNDPRWSLPSEREAKRDPRRSEFGEIGPTDKLGNHNLLYKDAKIGEKSNAPKQLFNSFKANFARRMLLTAVVEMGEGSETKSQKRTTLLRAWHFDTGGHIAHIGDDRSVQAVGLVPKEKPKYLLIAERTENQQETTRIVVLRLDLSTRLKDAESVRKSYKFDASTSRFHRQGSLKQSVAGIKIDASGAIVLGEAKRIIKDRATVKVMSDDGERLEATINFNSIVVQAFLLPNTPYLLARTKNGDIWMSPASDCALASEIMERTTSLAARESDKEIGTIVHNICRSAD